MLWQRPRASSQRTFCSWSTRCLNASSPSPTAVCTTTTSFPAWSASHRYAWQARLPQPRGEVDWDGVNSHHPKYWLGCWGLWSGHGAASNLMSSIGSSHTHYSDHSAWMTVIWLFLRLPERFQGVARDFRATRELWESFQSVARDFRAIRELWESFEKAFRKMPESFHFQRASRELPDSFQRVARELSKSFQRAARELS